METLSSFGRSANPVSYSLYHGLGYEIEGFAWHQGWNDRVNAAATAEDEVNMANLIRDLRAEFGVPGMPVVIGRLNRSLTSPPGACGSSPLRGGELGR